jgi:hypothetical protein
MICSSLCRMPFLCFSSFEARNWVALRTRNPRVGRFQEHHLCLEIWKAKYGGDLPGDFCTR